MSKKPASININLVPKDPFFHTPLGRGLQWALSAGRYIIIFTELIVIISFAARFTLDRQITDLNSEIVANQAAISNYGELENDFRLAQAKIENVQQIEQDVNIVDVFQKLTEVTPQDVTLSQLVISPSSVTVTGKTLSQTSFNLLVNNLQLSSQFRNVTINKVGSEEDGSPGLLFNIIADTKVRDAKAVNTQTEEKINVLDRTQGL
jgi:Tfp pilus assembly protein PilN